MTADLTRRSFLGRGVAGVACCGTITAGAGLGAAATAGLAVPEAHAAHGKWTDLSADQALAVLKEGNERFVADSLLCERMDQERRKEVAEGQTPFAALVACSYSRVPPELLFGRGLGELFIVRNAGNTVDTAAMGSLEYAVAVLGVPLVVVLGHQRCGAVEAALAVVEGNIEFPGSIGPMIQPILPAALAARGEPGDMLDNAVHQNVRRVVSRLRAAPDETLAEPQRFGRLRIVGAYYRLDDGRVDFFMEG